MRDFKIVMISDTHGFHRDPHLEIPDGSLLIHAGDLSMGGELEVLSDVNEWFGEIKHNYNDIVVIGGNHDRTLGHENMLGFKMFTHAIYLENSKVEIDGKLIYGSPQTPWTYQYVADMFAFGKKRGETKWNIPKTTDILVTHGPPFGFGDLLAEGSSDPNTHIGDKNLLDNIMMIKPELNVFGHIHEGYGIYEEEYTTFINASVVDERYDLVNEPVVIEV